VIAARTAGDNASAWATSIVTCHRAVSDKVRSNPGLTGAVDWFYPTTTKAREPKGVGFVGGRRDVPSAP
jgi:hypothetical protein